MFSKIKNNILGLFINNWRAKLICLFISFLLWGYVRISKYDTIKLELPVSYKKLPEYLSFSSEPPKFISLEIRGRKTDLNFNYVPVQGEIDLSKAHIGTTNYIVKHPPLLLPSRVEIVDEPKISLTIEKLKQKLVRINAIPKGNIIENYKLGYPIIVPDKILLQGPESKIKLYSDVNVYVDVSNAQEDIDTFVDINPIPNIKFVTSNHINVKFQVIQDKILTHQIIESIPISILNYDTNKNFILETKEAKVTIEGDPKVIANLNKSDINVSINFDGVDFINTDEIILPVTATLFKYNESLLVVSVIPNTIKVKNNVSLTNENKIHSIEKTGE